VAGGTRQAAKDRAYAFVKDQVLRGVFEGGDLISEGDVASALEMSRTPIREAFLRLEVEGFLRLYPQRGALVVPVSPAEVRSVLEARLVLELFAAEKLAAGAASAREEVADGLDAGLSRQHELIEAGELGAFLEEDRLFHTRMVEAAGNELFSRFYASLRDRQVRMIAESLLADRGRRETILAEHREIAEAVRSGDPDRAEAAVRTHLASTRSALGLA